MSTLDLIKSVEHCILNRSYRDDNSRPANIIDNYIYARYKEIKDIAAEIDELMADKKFNEVEEKFRKARFMTASLREAIKYLMMYEALFPEESSKLKEEGIPDVITDMILYEIEENIDDTADLIMNR